MPARPGAAAAGSGFGRGASAALIGRPARRAGPECVTAPRCAGPTSFAYFSSTPLSALDGARLPGGAPARELGGVEQQRRACARSPSIADPVAVAHQRDRPAERCLGADVADHQAARRAREAAVGEERDLLAHALAVDERGDAEHLAHAGAAARAFVADHEHVALAIVARADGGEGVLLALEDARRALEHARRQAGDLDQRAVGCEVALQHDDAAGRAAARCAASRTTSPSAARRASASSCGQRAARERERVAVQVAAVEQRLQHRRDAADAMQVDREEAAARLQVGDRAACARTRRRRRRA